MSADEAIQAEEDYIVACCVKSLIDDEGIDAVLASMREVLRDDTDRRNQCQPNP